MVMPPAAIAVRIKILAARRVPGPTVLALTPVIIAGLRGWIRLAAVTPAKRTRVERPSSRCPSLELTKITVKSAPACSLRIPSGWRFAPLRTVIFLGT